MQRDRMTFGKVPQRKAWPWNLKGNIRTN